MRKAEFQGRRAVAGNRVRPSAEGFDTVWRLVRRHWFAHLMSCCYPWLASAMMRRSMGVNGGTSSMAVFHSTVRLTCMQS